MEARTKNSANDCKPKMGRVGRQIALFHVELNQQETEFLMMSKVKIFLRRSLVSSGTFVLWILTIHKVSENGPKVEQNRPEIDQDLTKN